MKPNYTKLSRIMFTRGLGITLGAVASVFLLWALARGHLTDTTVRWITQGFSVSETQTDIVYFKAVTTSMQFILGIVIILFMFLLFHMLLHSYKRYFDEVLLGIDKLMEDGGRISLSPELETVECKLNYAKQTLRTRADEIKEMEQQKNDLVVHPAHDIKTPLTSVIGYFGLLDENPDMTDDKKAEYVHTAQEKADRLGILVNEFFEITRGYSESTAFHKTKIDLYYMPIQISEGLYPQLSTYKKHTEDSMDENTSVYGGSEELARVSNNILKNVISYSEDNSAILVSVKEFPKKTVIRFENKGNIPNDKLSPVFDRFYRLDSTGQSGTGGSGPGFAIIKDIVTLYDGWMQAESNNGYIAFIAKIPSAACKDLGMTSQKWKNRML